MTALSRRSLLKAGAALPAAGLTANMAQAQAPMLGQSFAEHRRFKIGAFEVTTMLIGSVVRDNPQGTFGMNATPEAFAAASQASFIASDKMQLFFAPTVVNTGSELILFDTGFNGPGISGALENAGYTADQIDTVVLTHMHGDHIGGLLTDGEPTCRNARYIAGEVEYDYWAAADNSGFETSVRPLAERMTFVGDGYDVASGITGVAAFGHTPGHMVYRLESQGEGLVIFADLANHPVWSLARPDWEVRFDIDKAAAAASRKNILGMIAADRIPAIGYHMPFPSVGYVDASGADTAFRWVPETGQLMG